jgi:hypothetical protein
MSAEDLRFGSLVSLVGENPLPIYPKLDSLNLEYSA